MALSLDDVVADLDNAGVVWEPRSATAVRYDNEWIGAVEQYSILRDLRVEWAADAGAVEWIMTPLVPLVPLCTAAVFKYATWPSCLVSHDFCLCPRSTRPFTVRWLEAQMSDAMYSALPWGRHVVVTASDGTQLVMCDGARAH